MSVPWNTVIWQQFGAAIDMLDNALRACPEEHWQDSPWTDPTDAPEYTQFWFIVFHTLKWLDFYLSGTDQGYDHYELPAPFLFRGLPEKPYTKEQLQAYLLYCREKCRSTFETLTDEKAIQSCVLPSGEGVSYAELQLYCMRHVQEHTAQLSLHLGQAVGSAPDWVSRAESKDA
jgi:hypothetical protein